MCLVLTLNPYSNCIMQSWELVKNDRVIVVKEVTEFFSLNELEGLRACSDKSITIRMDPIRVSNILGIIKLNILGIIEFKHIGINRRAIPSTHLPSLELKLVT